MWENVLRLIQDMLFQIIYQLYTSSFGFYIHQFLHRHSLPSNYKIKVVDFSNEIRIATIPCLINNLAYVIYAKETKEAYVVDASDSLPIIAFLKENELDCKAIFSTHKHWDHTAGNGEILKHFPRCLVLGATNENVFAKNRGLKHKDVLNLFPEMSSPIQIQAISTPCHTRGHLVYRISGGNSDLNAIFTGDTLFVGGVGKFFEGSAQEMYENLFHKILSDNAPQTVDFLAFLFARFLEINHCIFVVDFSWTRICYK